MQNLFVFFIFDIIINFHNMLKIKHPICMHPSSHPSYRISFYCLIKKRWVTSSVLELIVNHTKKNNNKVKFVSLCIWLINEEWHVWKQVYGSWWKNSCVFQVTIRLFYECFFLDAWLQTLLHYFAHTWPAFHSNLFILRFAFTQSWAVNLIYVDKIKYRNERHIPQIVLRFILSNKLSCQINKKKKKSWKR